jgi:hypothetical protein
MSEGRQKESILDLGKFLNKSVRVELSGGRKGKKVDNQLFVSQRFSIGCFKGL